MTRTTKAFLFVGALTLALLLPTRAPSPPPPVAKRESPQAHAPGSVKEKTASVSTALGIRARPKGLARSGKDEQLTPSVRYAALRTLEAVSREDAVPVAIGALSEGVLDLNGDSGHVAGVPPVAGAGGWNGGQGSNFTRLVVMGPWTP